MPTLQRQKLEIQGSSVKEWSWIINDAGKNTLEKHVRTIGPTDDISNEPEDIQLACQAARLSYVKPDQGLSE